MKKNRHETKSLNDALPETQVKLIENAAMNRERPFPHDGYVRIKEVLRFLKIGRTTFYAGISKGLYPTQKKISKRISVWSCREIRDFLDRL